MNTYYIPPFHVVGIAVRTTNYLQRSAGDIAALWEKFWKENIFSQIPDKISADIYCVYAEYQGDHTQPYTTVIGCRVENTDRIPEGMKAITAGGGEFVKLTAKGKLSEGVVIQEWVKIWQSDMKRAYKADYEVYPAGMSDPDNAEIDIFVEVL